MSVRRRIPENKRRFGFLRRYWHRTLYIAYVFIALTVVTNLVFPASNIPVVSINWYTGPPPYNWILTIPPSGTNQLNIRNDSVIMVTKVSANPQFVDGDEISVHVLACESVPFIRQILVGFDGAYWWPLSSNGFQGGGILGGVTVHPAPNATFSGLTILCPVQNATSHPIVFTPDSRGIVFREPNTIPVLAEVSFTNGSVIDYNYPYNTITIQSSEMLNQDHRSTAEGIAVAGAFIFGIIELPRIIREVQAKPPTQKSKSTSRQNGKGRKSEL